MHLCNNYYSISIFSGLYSWYEAAKEGKIFPKGIADKYLKIADSNPTNQPTIRPGAKTRRLASNYAPYGQRAFLETRGSLPLMR